MEQRIKIVWIFSIASILLITCGQVYWLRNQYQYMNMNKSMVFMIASCRPPNSMTLSVLPQPKKGA